MGKKGQGKGKCGSKEMKAERKERMENNGKAKGVRTDKETGERLTEGPLENQRERGRMDTWNRGREESGRQNGIQNGARDGKPAGKPAGTGAAVTLL